MLKFEENFNYESVKAFYEPIKVALDAIKAVYATQTLHSLVDLDEQVRLMAQTRLEFIKNVKHSITQGYCNGSVAYQPELNNTSKMTLTAEIAVRFFHVDCYSNEGRLFTYTPDKVEEDFTNVTSLNVVFYEAGL